jgi:hypothetical protein
MTTNRRMLLLLLLLLLMPLLLLLLLPLPLLLLPLLPLLLHLLPLLPLLLPLLLLLRHQRSAVRQHHTRRREHRSLPPHPYLEGPRASWARRAKREERSGLMGTFGPVL